jgi:hypothetical protein
LQRKSLIGKRRPTAPVDEESLPSKRFKNVKVEDVFPKKKVGESTLTVHQ